MGHITFSETSAGNFVDNDSDYVMVYGKRNICFECKNTIVKASDCILIGVENEVITEPTISIPKLRLLFDINLLIKLIRGIYHIWRHKRRYENETN